MTLSDPWKCIPSSEAEYADGPLETERERSDRLAAKEDDR